ncbi:MAG: IS1595 family transposase, partial [Bacilli bacterium]
MSKVDIKAIIKDFDREQLQNLISIAQGVLTSLFSSD